MIRIDSEGYSGEDHSLLDEQNDDQTPSTSHSGSSSTGNSTAQHQLFMSLSNYLRKKETENARRLSKGSSYGTEKQQSLSLINRSLTSRRRLNRRERNIHPVTSYFLITDEKSKCAVCILCLNVMKAGKTANLMRHMSRYHKLVAVELEKQWDLIKIKNSSGNNNNKATMVTDTKNQCHTDTVLYTSSNNDQHTAASPFTNESSNNGSSPLVDLSESATTNTTLLPNDSGLIDNDNDIDLPKTEQGQDGSVHNGYAINMQLFSNVASSSADRARQEELIKKTERLFEENAKREERVERKEDELQKVASELSNKYDQQHKLLTDLTSKLQFIIANMHNEQPP
ncbi:unnamed protein product [Anisakis simplex]|uniref:BED-type domain-containing protein n=1 Tax=Anisakis simplex TaxID=6269 RepID=A0A0M3K7T3_ANISI|nr:unnamed protein product [Anisakis simplex]